MTSEQSKRFKYWQMRTIIATMIGYALFYFVRKNFSLAMPGLEADLGISKTSLGVFLTLNGLIYGFSRFANGILAEGVRNAPGWVYSKVSRQQVADTRADGVVLTLKHWPEQAERLAVPVHTVGAS